MKKLLILLLAIALTTTSYALVKDYHSAVQPFIDAFKTNNKDYVAEVFERGGITTKADFIERFDEYFDESLSDKIANSALDDWDMMGWRGIMLDDGLIWLDEDGSFIHANYETEKAKQLRLEAIQKDKDSLHPTMQNFISNTHQWQTATNSIRIDKLPNEKYRFSSWSGHDLLELPNMVINNGTFDCDEERFFCHATGGGNEYYTFTQGSKKYIIHPPGGITSESSPIASIEIYNNNKLVLDKYLCDTESCLNRAKDESNEKLVFESVSYGRSDN